MNLINNYLQKCLLAFLLAAFSFASYAGPGHDHGDDKSTAPTTSVHPRFYMESELYEAVAILDGMHINLYLDSYRTNKTVTNAQLELKVNDQEIKLTSSEDGFYQGNWDKSLNDKTLTISLSIRIQDGDDILVTTFDPNDFHVKKEIDWWYWLKWVALVLLGSVLSVFLYKKKHQIISLYKKLEAFVKERI